MESEDKQFKCKKCGYIGNANMTFSIDEKPISMVCFMCFAQFVTQHVGQNLERLPSIQGTDVVDLSKESNVVMDGDSNAKA